MYEADIRGYFDHINHEWLRKMVAHRIADPVILSLIGKWLRAGVMQDGVVVRVARGVAARRPDQSRAREYLPALRSRPMVREEVQSVVPGGGVPGAGSPTTSSRAFSTSATPRRLDRILSGG